MFDSIVKNEQKQQEKEIQAQIKKIEGFADDVLRLLRDREVTLAECAMTLKSAERKLNQKGSEMKLREIL